MAQPGNPHLPDEIGRYQVLGILGSGAMGTVVLAEDPRIKRKVAIKLMKLEAVRTEADQRELLARFQREAEVSGLLNHPGIVAIYDVGEVEGHGPFLAMEFVPGKPLDELMQAGSGLTLRDKLRIAAALADALDHAHAKGIIHRDVKPGNVMVGEGGRPKLMDFGIAKREDASLTQTGTFLGTPSYASPEQIREGTVDNRSDIFSFGVLVFELLSGKSPFPGTTINTILYRIVNEPPVEVEPPVLGILPDGWRRVFDRVLAKQPADRYPTCTAFIRDLLEVMVDLSPADRREVQGLLRLDEEPPLPPIVTHVGEEVAAPKGRRRSPLGWLAAGLAGLALLAGLGWLYLRGAVDAQIRIATAPSGATIFINDLEAGTTPSTQRLRSGDQVRLVLKGFQPISHTFGPGSLPPVFTFEPVISRVMVRSIPEGATLVLDEKQLEGVTPLEITWNQGQEHRLTLTKDGGLGAHQDFGIGETPEGLVFGLAEATTAETRPEASLDPNAPGFLKLSGGFAVRIVAGGKDYGELSPGAKLSLPIGPHKLELSNPKVFYHAVQNVLIAAGQAQAVTVPGLASLTVETFPGSGKVFVDDKSAGIESDGSSIQLARGKHKVTVHGPRGARTEQVDLSGGDQSIRFQL